MFEKGKASGIMLMEMGGLVVGRSSRRLKASWSWGDFGGGVSRNQANAPTWVDLNSAALRRPRPSVQVLWVLPYACRKGAHFEGRTFGSDFCCLWLVVMEGVAKSHTLALDPRPVVSSWHPCHPTLVVGTCGVLGRQDVSVDQN